MVASIESGESSLRNAADVGFKDQRVQFSSALSVAGVGRSSREGFFALMAAKSLLKSEVAEALKSSVASDKGARAVGGVAESEAVWALNGHARDWSKLLARKGQQQLRGAVFRSQIRRLQATPLLHPHPTSPHHFHPLVALELHSLRADHPG